MGKTNSKSIGNQYERDFSYKLSEWLTGEKDADVCWRDLSSGARSTSRKKGGKDTALKADIVATDLRYQPLFDVFFIDTKCYKDFNPIIINPKNINSNKIFLEWMKVCSDCPDSMWPIMPCRIRDRKTPEFIIIPFGVSFNCDQSILYSARYKKDLHLFRLVLQDDFFNLNNWKELIEKNKKY